MSAEEQTPSVEESTETDVSKEEENIMSAEQKTISVEENTAPDDAEAKPAETDSQAEPDEKTDVSQTDADADSDSGKLVIAERAASAKARRKPATPVVTQMRRSMPSRVKGRGMAYLIAMEKGGRKKRGAQSQADDSQDPSSDNLKSSDAADSEGIGNEMSANDSYSTAAENDTLNETPQNSPAVISKPRSGNFPKKSHGLVDVTSPMYREPFKFGWRREVVFRAVNDPNKKNMCDVYYYSPTGKKLRSSREVMSYLEKTGSPLDVENFTYFKEPLGAEPENEILRHAKRKDEMFEKRTPRQEKTPKPHEKTPKVKEENETIRKNLEELDKDVAAITGILPEEAPPQPEEPKPAQEETKSPPQKRKTRSEKAERQMKVRLFNRRSRGTRSKENAEPLISPKEEPLPCSRDCAKAEGQWPSQTCQKCFSLFHPVCVGGDNPTECLRCSTPAASSVTPTPVEPVEKSSESPSKDGAEAPPTPMDVDSPAKNVAIEPTEATPAARPKPQRKSKQPQAASRQNAELNGKRPAPGTSPESKKHADSPVGLEPQAESSPPRKVAKLSGLSAIPVARSFWGGSSSEFVNCVSMGYHGLLQVFKYLTVQELMTASRVCKLWRDLAFHHSHWHSVRLKNSRIYNWAGFTAHLRRTGTRHLDLRKMLFVTSQEETWQNVEQSCGNLSELVRIDLCKCPSSVLEHVAQHALQLQIIDAQAISSATVRLAPLSNLTQLRDLKLRGVSSLSVSDGYHHLSSLTGLKYLSLTSLSNLNSADVKFVGKLMNLEVLELGDCDKLTDSSAFEVFSSLPKLRHVRLERGPSNAAGLEMLNPLCRLPHLNQLELVNYEMKSNAIDFFTGLSALKRLLIIPRYSADTVQSTVEYLFTVLPLMWEVQQLYWVFTDTLVSSIRDGRVNLQLPGLAGEPFSLENLQELLREKMPRTNVRMIQLPEYSAQRFNLSQNAED